MRDVERNGRGNARRNARPGERMHEPDDVVGVDDHAVEHGRGKAVGKQHRHAHATVAALECTGAPEQATHVTDHAPGIHLPGGPHTLPKKEIAGEGRKGTDHKAVARPERHARDDSDGRDGLEVRDGTEEHAPGRGERGEHERGHDLPERRTLSLVPRKKERDHQRHHREHEQRRLRHARIKRQPHANGHGQQHRRLDSLPDTREHVAPSRPHGR